VIDMRDARQDKARQGTEVNCYTHNTKATHITTKGENYGIVKKKKKNRGGGRGKE
jgi:hypothetical protein